MPNHLILDLPEKTIRPGDTLHGEILWDLESPPKSLYLSFGWWTSGRGDRDEFVVADREWEDPRKIGKEAFSFPVPPIVVPSFSGRLISVEWGLQLSANGSPLDDVIEPLIISPTLQEIDISADTYQSKAKSVSIRKGRRFSISNRR